MSLEKVNPSGTFAISGTRWNDLVDGDRRHSQIFAGAGISIFNSGGSITISNTRAAETGTATINNNVPYSTGVQRGAYRATVKRDPANPQASSAIAGSDFGTDGSLKCIVLNAAELHGGAPLEVSDSPVVEGRWSGFNILASGGVGTSDDNGLPVLEVDAYVTPWAEIAVTVTAAGTTSTLPTYAGTLPDGSTFTGINPTFRNFRTPLKVTGGDIGKVFWNGSAWVLNSCNEYPSVGCGS